MSIPVVVTASDLDPASYQRYIDEGTTDAMKIKLLALQAVRNTRTILKHLEASRLEGVFSQPEPK